MSYLSGKHGQLFVKPASSSNAPTPVGSLRSWQISQQMNVLDTTTLGATDRTLTDGIRSYTGSATLLYYTESTSNVKLMISNSFFVATKTNRTADDFGHNSSAQQALLRLRLDDGGQGTKDIDCICYITGFSISCTVGEVVTAEINFEGTGLPVAYSMF